MKQITVLSMLVAVCAALGPPSASGALIIPGQVLFPAPQEIDPAGTGDVVAVASVPFGVAGKFSGVLTSLVIANDLSNPLGGLTFAYFLTNDGFAGPNSIGRLSVTDFSGFLTDVSFQPLTGVAPAYVDRSASTDVIGFSFVPSPFDPLAGFLAPGQSSALLVVQTNAYFAVGSTAFVIDGGVASVGSFGPAIPEPATALLILAGLAVPMRNRRRHIG